VRFHGFCPTKKQNIYLMNVAPLRLETMIGVDAGLVTLLRELRIAKGSYLPWALPHNCLHDCPVLSVVGSRGILFPAHSQQEIFGFFTTIFVFYSGHARI